MAYLREDYIRAWFRSAFGLLLAIMLLFIFQSAFLSLLTFIFLSFIPIENARIERLWNMLIFSGGMLVILFFAFGFGSYDIGLGLDLGIKIGAPQVLAAGLLIVALIAKGLLTRRQIVYPAIGPGASVIRQRTNSIQAILSISIFVLFIASAIVFTPWQWNISAILFMAIWLVSFLTGVFSDHETRRPLGVVMIVISLLIFTLGIGSNIVGEVAFGQWWPAVKGVGDTTIVPLIGVIEDFTLTMKDSWRLITCPTCVVQDIVTGRFGRDSNTGLSGAFGVEFLGSPKTTSMFPYTDYSITAEVRNDGGSEAKNVVVSVHPGTKTPQEAMDSFSPSTYLNFINPDKISLEDLGFAMTTIDNISVLGKQQAMKFEFETSKQLSCETVNKYKLETKTIPLIMELQYNYRVTSKLPVEVFSATKWDEEIRKDKVAAQKKPAELSNSPVKLNLDIGEQPKIEGDNIILTVNLEKAKKEVGIKNVTNVVLHYPPELTWTKARGCKGAVEGGNNSIVWYGTFPQTLITNCHFALPTLTVPSTTFEFSAEAEYTVSTLKGFDEKMDWRTGCCSDSVCSDSWKCTWKSGQKEVGRCEPEGITTPGTDYTKLRGEPNYCEELEKQTNQVSKCTIGSGGCSSDLQCDGPSSAGYGDLKCRNSGTIPVKTCCYENAPDDVCEAFYGEFLR